MHYTIICLGSSWGKKWINLERVLDRVALVPFALQFIHKTYFPIYRFYFNYEGMSDRAGGRREGGGEAYYQRAGGGRGIRAKY